MFITLYDNNISQNHLDIVIKSLKNDGIGLVPTDTLYAFVCDIHSHKASRRLADLKGKKLEKSNFSILCNSLSMASKYVKPLSNNQFAFIKSLDTAGFTFVLQASSLTPKIFQNKKRTIGIRIPQNSVLNAIIDQLGHPLLVTSVPNGISGNDDEQDNNSFDNNNEEIYKNAELIYEKYASNIDFVLDAGEIISIPSTVLDMTDGDNYEIIRSGLGKL